VLAELESVAGWTTARVQRPLQILRILDGIETVIRQLIRDTPRETQKQSINVGGEQIEVTLSTPSEMLWIKAVLILERKATRDYLNFAALSEGIDATETLEALANS
jgi:hypothetical protein